MLEELTIFQKTYDLILWLFPAVNKFPKSQRFVLGQRIEDSILEFLRLMIRANASRNKLPILADASVELDQLRILIRLSKDLKFISINQYGFVSKMINEIGRMLGGWMKLTKQ